MLANGIKTSRHARHLNNINSNPGVISMYNTLLKNIFSKNRFRIVKFPN